MHPRSVVVPPSLEACDKIELQRDRKLSTIDDCGHDSAHTSLAERDEVVPGEDAIEEPRDHPLEVQFPSGNFPRDAEAP